MIDLRARMHIYEQAPVPELWTEITARVPAASVQVGPRNRPPRLWIALAAASVTVLIGGALLIGSGLIELPIPPEPVPLPTLTPSVTPEAAPSAAPSAAADEAQWSVTGDMVYPGRGGLHAATLLDDGRVLIVGAVESGSNRAGRSAELFDPASGSWTPVGDMLEPQRLGHSASLLPDGTVLIAGGFNQFAGLGDPGVGLSSAELFNPATGTWTATGSMNGPRTHHFAATLLDGRILVMSGTSNRFGDGPIASAELYDPASAMWSVIDGPGVPVGTVTVLADGRVLVTGTGGARLFDPSNVSWSQPAGAPATLGTFEGDHSATLLADGRVLIAGGGPCCLLSPPGPTLDPMIFDPATGTWNPTGDMVLARYGHSATLLSDGRVLVAGGADPETDGHTAISAAEIFDPGSGSWVATVDLPRPAGYHQAIALRDGRVLIVGTSPPGIGLLYDPSPGD